MDRDDISRGLHNIVTGVLFCGAPALVKYFVTTPISNGETGSVPELMSSMISMINGLGTIIQFIGISMVAFGIISLATGMAHSSPGFDSLNYYDSSTKTLVFWVLEKRKFKNIDVKLGSLSDKTIEVLRSKIETPLKELYEAASKGKRAKAEYRNCSVYISSLADDLNKAISQCENELMEEKLIDKLYIIENTITNIKDKINDAITADKDEERYLKELQLESYEPFTLTDNMNKLI